MQDLLHGNLALAGTAPGVYEGTADRTWWGHDALFGGYAQALVLAAMRRSVDDAAKAPKSMTMHFLRPFLDGPQRIEVGLEREGRNMANVTARAWSGGKLAGLALANFGTNRRSPSFVAARMPDVAPLGAEEAPVDPAAGIPTHELFDFFPRMGGLRFSSGVSEVGGWVRPRFPAPADEYLCTVLADLWLPAAYHRWEVGAVAVSADITMHFRASLPAGVAPGSPLFVVLRAAKSGDGWADEDGEIWTADGELLAQSRQVRFVHS
jgi:acyl-CoA thioesterase